MTVYVLIAVYTTGNEVVGVFANKQSAYDEGEIWMQDMFVEEWVVCT